MPTIKAPSKPTHTYWPKELREAGFTGDLDARIIAAVLVIPKPQVSKRAISDSLALAAKQFRQEADIEEQSA